MRFSPDGQWIAFSLRGALHKVSVDGGAVIPLGDFGVGAGMQWPEPGGILASRAFEQGILRVNPDNGATEPLAPLAPGETALAAPSLLPGGKAVLFTQDNGGGIDSLAIGVVTLADKQRKVLARGGHSPFYVATSARGGHLLYNTRSTLFAMPFDPDALEARGPAVPMVTDMAFARLGTGQFDVSETGTLVYMRAQPEQKRMVQWVDPAGRTQPVLAEPGAYQALSLSPDGTRIAFTAQDTSAGADVWVYDLRRGSPTRVTTTGTHRGAVWTPDGTYLAVSRSLRGVEQVRLDAAAAPQPLTPDDVSQYPGSFSPDGKSFVYVDASGTRQIRSVPIQERDGKLEAGPREPVAPARFNERLPVLSPDGRWLAYVSDESKRLEIYVRPFPSTAAGQDRRWQISNAGGDEPRWSRDGRRIVYRAGDQLMSVAYAVKGDAFVADAPKVWIERLGAVENPEWGAVWDLAPDGERVIVVTPMESAETPQPERHVVILLNFFDELRRRAPLPK